LNILLLTSEFAPAQGGIGTYAREMATAATALGAQVTVAAPGYGENTVTYDEALPFAVPGRVAFLTRPDRENRVGPPARPPRKL
jgi:glycogen synthase